MGNMNNGVLREAKRLYKLGYAIHWLHPRSKRPVESKWTTGPRKEWTSLQSTYSDALNVGVRLGAASKINDKGYLAVIDVDVKSTEEKHREQALAAAKKLLKGKACPVVLSGRGNGSRHYHCVTSRSFKPYDAEKSKEIVKVFMPSAKPSKNELETLTGEEIKKGLRLRPAWEISIMSEGRQVVLPPSIHPDSNRPYTWARNIGDIESLPVIEFDAPEETAKVKDFTLSAGTQSKPVKFDFEVAPVILEWLDISDKVKQGIIHGKNVTDRSGYLMTACNALLSAGCSRDEILTILTEPDTFLGQCAYEHAQTKDRKRAARWVWRYTLEKIMGERDLAAKFDDVSNLEEKVLTEKEAAKQEEEFEAEILDWRSDLDRSKAGNYLPSLKNCRLILQNVCASPEIAGRDEFSINDYYLVNTPWRSKKGQAIIDHDITRIKFYANEHFNIEFGDKIIEQCLQEIADVNRFHPVREYLTSLKWDGVDRVDTWLKDYAGAVAPEPYLSDVSRKFLVAMVARIMRPGIKFDTILILEGNQGTGKSTMLARLAGGKWFTDAALNIGDKDSVLTIQAKWLVELGELSSMSKADLDLFKAFVSMQTDRIRAPYGKRMEEFPRQSVFAGTTNLDEYLRDLTGNRRFWTVKLTREKIDFDGISGARDQLFAEALALYNMGEPIYLDNPESEAQATIEQKNRLQVDEWQSTVRKIVTADDFPADAFEITDVSSRMAEFGAHKLSPTDGIRIGRCLRMLGYEAYRESSGLRRRMWRVVCTDNASTEGHRRPSSRRTDKHQ